MKFLGIVIMKESTLTWKIGRARDEVARMNSKFITNLLASAESYRKLAEKILGRRVYLQDVREIIAEQLEKNKKLSGQKAQLVS